MENRALKGVFGPERVTAGEVHYLYSSRSIVRVIMGRKMKCAGYVTLEGKRHLTCAWEDNV